VTSAIMLVVSLMVNHGYPTLTISYFVIGVLLLSVGAAMCSGSNRAKHGYPVLVVLIMIIRIMLCRRAVLQTARRSTNHGYPMLVVFTTVYKGCVRRGVIMVNAFI
jgi:hypothetical protein